MRFSGRNVMLSAEILHAIFLDEMGRRRQWKSFCNFTFAASQVFFLCLYRAL